MHGGWRVGCRLEHLIERYGQSVLAHGRHDSDVILREIEQFKPATELEWRTIQEFFLRLPSATWANIMTLRFLEGEPANIPARIANARYLSNAVGKQLSALNELDIIRASDGVSASHYMEMADISAKCGEPDKALQLIKQAIKIDPDNIASRTLAAHYYMNVQDHKSAKAEILEIRARAGTSVHVISTAMLLAIRLGDQAFVLENLDAALRSVPRDDDVTNGWLITVAARSKRPDHIAHLMQTINFQAIKNISELENIYRAIEGLGYLDHERILIDHALSLDRDNKLFLSASRQLDRAMTGLFPKSDGAVSPVRRRGIVSRTTMDRIREWFFWR